MDAYVKEAKCSFDKTIAALNLNLDKLHTGRANPGILAGIKCDYYGDKMDISDLCSISSPEPRQLFVKPYSREDIRTIAQGISAANINANVQTEAEGIRITVAPLTEETRKDNAKKAKGLGDDAKVSIRNVRRDTLSLLKEDDSMSDDYKDRVRDELEKEVSAANTSIDNIIATKQKELMSI
ncbi:MAG: ribosome recycling factor [Bacilli bacterium]|nr:ribosome recycling factor [Bacilli bacterium]